MSNTFRILAVISNQGLLTKIEGLMRRRTLEVHHVSSGAGALVLAGNLSYQLVIVESPLPDLELRELLAAMRGLDSTSDQAGFLVLAADGATPEALASRSDGAIRVIPTSADSAAVHDAVSELIGVAARRAARLLVEVEIHLGEGPSRLLYQSQNLSESGILLRGGTKLTAGSEVRFELALPGGDAVVGKARVVRHTTEREPIAGTALQFLDLDESEQTRLHDFVYAGLTTDDEPLRVAGGEA